MINRFSVLAVLAFSELACSGSKSETRAATPATETPAPAGDLVRGGQLYDTWWKVAGVKDTTPPAGNNPDYARTTGTQQGPATWRCKECHGWDYRGRDGAYQSGSHASGVAGLGAASGRSPQWLQQALKAGLPEVGKSPSPGLSDQDVLDLAQFLRGGLVDLTPHVDAQTRQVKGADANNGRALFERVCLECHGADGREENFGSAEAPEFVGTVARKNPWEFVHKVRFGQPGTEMPSAVRDGWTLQQVLDVLAYAQTLPDT